MRKESNQHVTGTGYMYVTQWLEHPTSVWKVIGSNSSQRHIFFFCPTFVTC